MSMKLYEFGGAYLDLWKRIGESTDGPGEWLDTDLKGEFDRLESDHAEKVENIAKMIRSLSATHDALEDESKRLKSRAATVKGKLEWLRSYVASSMHEIGRSKIEGSVLNISLSRNHRVQIENEKELPDEFKTLTETVTVLKADIRKALLEDRDVPGASLTETHSIRIR